MSALSRSRRIWRESLIITPAAESAETAAAAAATDGIAMVTPPQPAPDGSGYVM